MHLVKRSVFQAAVGVLRVCRNLLLDLHVEGRENVGAGPKIFVTNHISSIDPYWVLPEFREPVHMVIGPGYAPPLLAGLLDDFEQINALKTHRKTVVEQAVTYLKRGESVYILPEGDLYPPFQLGRFYPGVARMYRRTGAPIIPIAVVAPPQTLRAVPRFDMNVDGRVYRAVLAMRGPYAIRIGTPFRPELQPVADERTDDQRIVDELRQRIQWAVDDIRRRNNW